MKNNLTGNQWQRWDKNPSFSNPPTHRYMPAETYLKAGSVVPIHPNPFLPTTPPAPHKAYIPLLSVGSTSAGNSYLPCRLRLYLYCAKFLFSGKHSTHWFWSKHFGVTVISRGLSWAQDTDFREWQKPHHNSAQEKISGNLSKLAWLLLIKMHWVNAHSFVNICELKTWQTASFAILLKMWTLTDRARDKIPGNKTEVV